MDSKDEIKEKIKMLKPELQGVFMKYLREMCHQESDMMIDFIAASRRDIKSTGHIEYVDEQEDSSPRGRRSAMLEERRSGSRMDHAPLIDDLDNKLAVERYVRKRDKKDKKEDKKSPTNTPAVEDEFGVVRPKILQVEPTHITYRPRIASDDEYDEETEEIMREMRAMSAHLDSERERQAEKIRKKKEAHLRKKGQIMDHAISLLQKAEETEIIIRKDKERQEMKLKKIIEKKKKERSEAPRCETQRQPSPSPNIFLASSIQVQHPEEAWASPTVNTPDNTAEDRHKKRKKKTEKDFSEHENSTMLAVNGVSSFDIASTTADAETDTTKKKNEIKEKDFEAAENPDEEKGEKKKRKKKKKENEPEERDVTAGENSGNEKEEKMKRKKKKKCKEKEDQDDVAENENSGDEKEEKKKRKKKKKEKEKKDRDVADEKENSGDDKTEKKKSKKKKKEKENEERSEVNGDNSEDEQESKKKRKNKKKEKEKEESHQEVTNVAWD